jgi:hypothetical protein
VRLDNKLRKAVSTVDNAEAFDGWAAVVLALDAQRQGRVGHYGVGDGAESLLPMRSS